MMTQNKRLVLTIIGTLLPLLIPLVAMQFTNEVNWQLNDFLIAGVLLLGTSLMIELILRKVRTKKNRILFSIVVLIVLILIWLELAVGIFGTPMAGS